MKKIITAICLKYLMKNYSYSWYFGSKNITIHSINPFTKRRKQHAIHKIS